MTKRNIGIVLLLVVLGGGGIWYATSGDAGDANGMDIGNAEFVARGKTLYARECAACHGKNLQGQTPDWRRPMADGTLPAPPHDETGHTWHHPDAMLFEITKYGRVKGADPRRPSNMPAYSDKLSDADIWAVLSYIKSRWPTVIRQRHDAINRRYGAAR